MPKPVREIKRRVPSSRNRQTRQIGEITPNRNAITTYYKEKTVSIPRKRRVILHEETIGVTVGHLRRLARQGGIFPLGEMLFNRTLCEVCGKGNDDDRILLCDKCNRGYHLYCLRPILPSIPSGDWFCDKCKEQDRMKYYKNKKKLEESQSLIMDFFKLDKPIPSPCRFNLRSRSTTRQLPRITSPIPKQGNHVGDLRCYVPSTDPVKLKRQQVALAAAMFQQGIAFSHDLVYREGCPPKMNHVQYDEQRHLLPEMNKNDREVYMATKRLWKEGWMAPVLVRQDDVQGFVVEADELIKKNTLLTEYVGEVDTLANNEQNSNDSIMDLLRSGDPNTSLVIIPEKRGNLARYLSGINNAKKEAKKKQNVRSARYVINNEIHVLLIALKDIKAGEILMYDYNGLDKNYPTEHFV